RATERLEVALSRTDGLRPEEELDRAPSRHAAPHNRSTIFLYHFSQHSRLGNLPLQFMHALQNAHNAFLESLWLHRNPLPTPTPAILPLLESRTIVEPSLLRRCLTSRAPTWKGSDDGFVAVRETSRSWQPL